MAKTLRELVTGVRLNLFEHKKIRYTRGTTTGAGNAGGTTAVDSNLSSWNDDYFNGAYFRPTSGDVSKHSENFISDFTSSTGTVTLGSSAGAQIATSVTYEIYDAGIWSTGSIIEWLNNELSALPFLLNDDALTSLIKKGTTSGTAGVASLPDDMIKFISLDVGSVTTPVLQPNEKNRFAAADAFGTIPASRPLAIFSGATAVDGNNLYSRIEYRPTNNVTLTWSYIPKMPDLVQADIGGSGTQNLTMPDFFADFLILGATVRCFMASEDNKLASTYKALLNERISAANQGLAGRTKVEK